MKYLYHGSVTQNIKTLEPRKRFTPNGEINYSAIYATPSIGFAVCHSFPWSTNEGVDLSIEDGKIKMVIPKDLEGRLLVPISVYKIEDTNFELTKEESTGYTWHSIKPAGILEEIQYKNVLEAMKEKQCGN
ncbi:MAG: hypothetical protein R3B65_01685 [Candidatus Paceibacterota bacterium]